MFADTEQSNPLIHGSALGVGLGVGVGVTDGHDWTNWQSPQAENEPLTDVVAPVAASIAATPQHSLW